MGDAAQEPAARIGMVNYINTAPLYETWKTWDVCPAWRVVEDTPAHLNAMLFEDRLDLGLVSSFEYGLHSGLYRILSNLSISSSGKVGSVFLFSRHLPEELGGKEILLTLQSMTSVALVKIILEEFYRVRPHYRIGRVLAASQQPESPEALLAIGDDALRIQKSGHYPHQFDLGEMWRQFTGLPFVFAVWAVRRDFLGGNESLLGAIHRQLTACMAEGLQNLWDISRIVAPRIPIPMEECYDYLKNIEYDLGDSKQQGLERFFQILINRGELQPQALPLNIWEPL